MRPGGLTRVIHRQGDSGRPQEIGWCVRGQLGLVRTREAFRRRESWTAAGVVDLFA